MSRNKIFASIVLCLWAMMGYSSSYQFDLRAPGQSAKLSRASSPSRVQSDDGVLRSSRLQAGVTRAAPLAVGDTLRFVLFDDVEAALVLNERMESPLGGDCFMASLDGVQSVSAVVLQTADGISAEVSDPEAGRIYHVVATADKVTVREIDPNAGKSLPSSGVVPEITAGADLLSAENPNQASTLVDVLVAFDSPAANWARLNGGGITNFATMAVQKANTVLANTGFASTFRFRLVGVMAVDADGKGDLDSTLSHAQSGSGDWAAIMAMREDVGADVVSVMIDTGSAYGTTGLGYSLSDGTAPSSFSEHPYNVCSVRAVAQSYTMVHEIGHNLGAGHSDRQQSSPGPQLYSYSAGYYFKANGKNYHTIMAYNDDGNGGTYTAVPYFSSPDYTYEGVAVGDATHDNVRTIAETYSAAANWRRQVVPMSYDVYFTPETGSMFADSITVTLSPGKAGLPIRYTLDGSAPTLGSTIYAGPITLTRTTTIRAATVTDGVLGPTFEASYFLSDLGAGVDAPQLVWRTSETYPWTFQATNTYDGVDALQSAWAPTDGSRVESWLETDIVGPTVMSFAFKRGYMYSSDFKVTCDGETLFIFNESGYPNEWRLAEVSIPEGNHAIRFSFARGGYYSNRFNGVYLDQIRFDALSRPPTILPETTCDEKTALEFTGEQEITILPPEGRTGSLFYTLDGGDPTDEGAFIYEKPIKLTRSTRVRAVFVEGGREPSVIVEGMYLERHPISPGEWTTDVESVKSAAQKDGRLIAVLLANYATCGYCKAFDPIANSPEFLSWAEANDIYLVTADASLNCDAESAGDWFWALHDGTPVSYPALHFVIPSAPGASIGTGLARNGSQVGTVTYDNTVASLVAGFASVLNETPPQAPTTTREALVDKFPVTVLLVNPNGSGKVYYTLDGSAPTRSNGTLYSVPLTIQESSTVLKAVVWNDSGVSSPVLVREFCTIGEVLGAEDILWTCGGDCQWVIDRSSPRTLKAPYVSGQTYSSWIQGEVEGKGRLVFRLRASSNTWQNGITVSRDGSTIFSYAYNAQDGTTKEVVLTNEVNATGTTTFRWNYTVADSDYNFSSNGAWLSGVEWIPEGGSLVAGGEVSLMLPNSSEPLLIPSDWILATGIPFTRSELG